MRPAHFTASAVVLAASASAGGKTFTSILDSATSPVDFVGNVAWINDRGDVMVSTRPLGSPFGLYLTTDGTDFTLMEGTDDTQFGFTLPQNLTNSRLTAFLDNDAIDLHRSSPTQDLVLAGPNVLSTFPSVNERGLVAYSVDGEIRTSDGATSETRAIASADVLWLNNDDQLAFFSRGTPMDPGGPARDVIVRDDPIDGPTTLVTTDRNVAGFFDEVETARLILRDAGDVLFVGTPDGGDAGLYLASDAAITPLVTTADGFASFNRFELAINERGTVVFGATTDAGETGIFALVDGEVETILRHGDPLFGSAVALDAGPLSPLTLTTGSLNEHDVLAFHYILDDGVEGVATVVVPEPAAAASLACGLALLASRRRRG